MIQVSHEMPLWMLKEGYDEELNDYSYALVHLFEESSEYYNHFVSMLQKGRTVILDNSIFELGSAFNMQQFLNWAERLATDGLANEQAGGTLVIVAPDALDDREQTLGNFRAFKRELSKRESQLLHKSNIVWMAVAQGVTMDDLVASYFDLQGELQQLVDASAAQAARIGVSFNCEAYGGDDRETEFQKLIAWSLGRIDFVTRLIHHKDAVTPLHLLGASVPQEFRAYVWAQKSDVDHPIRGRESKPEIVSLDTSNPIVHGLLGIQYGNAGELQQKQSIKLAEMMFMEKDTEHLETILYNCDMFRRTNQLGGERV